MEHKHKALYLFCRTIAYNMCVQWKYKSSFELANSSLLKPPFTFRFSLQHLWVQPHADDTSTVKTADLTTDAISFHSLLQLVTSLL